jgi:hypothetical protein
MIKKKIKKMLKNKYYQLFLIAPPKYSCWEQRTQGALHFLVEFLRFLHLIFFQELMRLDERSAFWKAAICKSCFSTVILNCGVCTAIKEDLRDSRDPGV